MTNDQVEQNAVTVFCSISKNLVEEVNHVLIPSLEKQKNIKKINLFFINYNADNTISIKMFKSSSLVSIKILNPPKPTGFGESHNYAFSITKPKGFFLIINPDMYLRKDCFSQMVKEFNKDVGLVEAKQLPYPHPKDIQKKEVFETNWASGCCLLINSTFFKKVEGFDSNYWMYLEDVDLSWKAWINGYKVLHNPKAMAYHFTGLYFKYLPNTYEIEDFWSMRNFFYISYVYWGIKGLRKAKQLINKTSCYNNEIKRDAYNSFLDLIKREKVKHIKIPNKLKNKIKIWGYNKFSANP